ncbi:hypothetical protein T484DRAFT_1798581 [Baffinella frigidus]|nr:hypothetical protein T484DRAFT_1798581 [Cryptophyta sp. CCMP2293]
MSQKSGGSAEPGGELPSMEAALRSLYMRVHPDLFTSFPAARAQTSAIEFKMKPGFRDALRRSGGAPGQHGWGTTAGNAAPTEYPYPGAYPTRYGPGRIPGSVARRGVQNGWGTTAGNAGAALAEKATQR